MARNLSGSTWDKQSRDINHRLFAFGEKRQIPDKLHQTHSVALLEKRDGYKKDFISFLKEIKVDESKKINTYMTKDLVNGFLDKRIENLSSKTAKNYVRGFGAMLKGLEYNNINIPLDYSSLDDKVKSIKNDVAVDLKNIHKSIVNPQETINALSHNEAVSLVTEIQYNLGFRVSEARELLKNPQKYVNDNKIENLKGKGNHIYPIKEIVQSLMHKILSFIGKVPSVDYVNKCIKKTKENKDKSSHGFRYAYVKELHDLGYSASEISKEINHHRIDITRYYLNRC